MPRETGSGRVVAGVLFGDLGTPRRPQGTRTREILGLLVRRPKLCQAEIGERLGYGRSSMTTTMHRLERRGLVVRERVGRKVCYTVAPTGHEVLGLVESVEAEVGG